MFVHVTMDDLVFLSNSSGYVLFHSYFSHYFIFPSYSDHASHKTSLACIYNSGVHFSSTFLYQFCFVVNKVLYCLIFCLVLSRLMEFDILFCYKFCSLNVMKSFQ